MKFDETGLIDEVVRLAPAFRITMLSVAILDDTSGTVIVPVWVSHDKRRYM